ncbi:MAG TPA: glycosyltransferase [Solirubrobacteraceae bacterium]
MDAIQRVPVAAMDPHRFRSVLPPPEFAALVNLIERSAAVLSGRVVWNVNSTARGGGVVELLRPLLGYSRGSGVDARWLVIGGDPAFFSVTKRLHNHLHGTEGDGGQLGAPERRTYDQVLAVHAGALAKLVQPRDIVILHDPQTAGLVSPLHGTGATVIWRCHVGVDSSNRIAREAWNFLLPYLGDADACIFSRAAFVWAGLPASKLAVIQPSIDVFSPKNAELAGDRVLAILNRVGVLAHRSPGPPAFTRSDGTTGRVGCRAGMLQAEPLSPGDPVVAQISRWDALKDPLGVLRGFAARVAPHSPAHLLLAGPAPAAVADDPEGADIFSAVCEAWHGLPNGLRDRVHLAALPMDDVDENAAVVNALQRHATIVVQKSIAEGFGLTVAEAMWKSRPVVASRIGGIQDQIVDGESGTLISDPSDPVEFGAAILGLLGDPSRAARFGSAAHERVRTHFLGPRHLACYFELIEHLITGAGIPPTLAPDQPGPPEPDRLRAIS